MRLKRNCYYCGVEFEIDTSVIGTLNRRYCCYAHSKMANLKRMRLWRQNNKETGKIYYERRTQKHPEVWKEKYYKRRNELIEFLGGKCIVCNETNKLWLQIDYKIGSKGYGWRHPRNKMFILKNKDDFQILCANHHQEKTIRENYKGYNQVG